MTQVSGLADTWPPTGRRYGYIPDPGKSPIHGHAFALVKGAAPTTPNCLSRMSAVIRNQASAASCVGFGLTQALLDRMLCQRTEDAKLGSPLWCYLMARLMGLARDHLLTIEQVVARLTATPPTLVLEDGGCMIPDAVEAMTSLGICAEAWAPYSDALVLAPTLQIEAYKHAFDQRGKGTLHRCADTPEQRERDYRASLLADFPIVDGQQVDQAFEDGPPGLWDFHGRSLGGHCMETVACDDVGVWKRNQWRQDWGVALPASFPVQWVGDDGKPAAPPTGGFVHVAWEAVLDPTVTNDAYAVQFGASFSDDVPGDLTA